MSWDRRYMGKSLYIMLSFAVSPKTALEKNLLIKQNKKMKDAQRDHWQYGRSEMKIRFGYSLGTEGEEVSFKTSIRLLWLLVIFVGFLTV